MNFDKFAQLLKVPDGHDFRRFAVYLSLAHVLLVFEARII
jgi:hypothetical protein